MIFDCPLFSVSTLLWAACLIFLGGSVLGLAALGVRLTNRTKVGEATRPRLTPEDGKPETVGQSSLISGMVTLEDGEAEVSCSFVEFDGRGDFLDFLQYKEAYETVRRLADKQRILLVIYCHGWKNNAQSGDVVKFNDFLVRLTKSQMVRGQNLRVHGVYLAWRGNVHRPCVDEATLALERQLEGIFGGKITSAAQQRRAVQPWWLWEQISYWGRKQAAEHQVSGVPMARTIFSCANVARDVRANPVLENKVVVIGHSFGALMLERCLGLASVGLLSTELVWQPKNKLKTEEQAPKAAVRTAMPFDAILFVNSAAPSLHARLLNGFLQMYRSGLERQGVKHPETPVIVSVTSTGDKATGQMHPLGNSLANRSRSLQRIYRTLGNRPAPAPVPEVEQSYYYERTPGHNPLLVNHWIVPVAATAEELDAEAVLNRNLDYNTTDDLAFLTTKGVGSGPAQGWHITDQVPAWDEAWQKVKGQKPKLDESAYWIMRCPPELIKDHGDVWSDAAMQMYAAIYRLVEKRRME